MHNATCAVQIGMNLALENAGEVGGYVLAAHFHNNSSVHLRAWCYVVKIGAFHHNRMVFDVFNVFNFNQLEAIHARTVNFHLHVGAANNLALERRGVGNRNVNLGNFDVNVACFQRCFNEGFRVRLQQNGFRNGANVVHVVGNNGEAHGHRASAKRKRVVVYRRKRIHECMQAHEGILHETVPVATFNGAKDHSSAHAERNNVAYCPNVFPNGYHTHRKAHFNAHAFGLVDNIAHQEYENTALLVSAN